VVTSPIVRKQERHWILEMYYKTKTKQDTSIVRTMKMMMTMMREQRLIPRVVAGGVGLLWVL
jgi:hypothetical protein